MRRVRPYWLVRRCSFLLVAATLGVAAAPWSAPPSTFLAIPAGPVLAGKGVLWTERIGSTVSLVLWRPGRHAAVVDRFTANGFVSLASSGSRALIARLDEACGAAKPGEAQPCVATEDALAGRPAGPFRSIGVTRSCTTQYPNLPAVDVDQTTGAYAESRCAPARVRVLDLAGPSPRTLFVRSLPSCCAGARIAGRYLAWSRASSIVIYDWKTQRVVRRFTTPTTVTDLDVQADGKVAALLTDRRIAWFSPSEPRVHRLPDLAAGTARGIRIAGDRIAFVRGSPDGTERDLVVADLAGHVDRIATFGERDRLSNDFASQSDVSFDGHSIVWASDHATEIKEECPPPPSLRPCRVHWRGVRTIWLERAGGKPLALARLPFDEPHVG